MPDIVVASDADWIFAQCRAALGGAHDLTWVRAGADVARSVRELDPALVLLDMQIGNMGAMAVCLAIRQEEGMGRLAPRPVLMLLDREADEFLARHSAADAWLVKPIDPLTLTNAVTAALVL